MVRSHQHLHSRANVKGDTLISCDHVICRPYVVVRSASKYIAYSARRCASGNQVSELLMGCTIARTYIHVHGEVRIRNHSVRHPPPSTHTHTHTHARALNLLFVDVSEPESAVRGGLVEFTVCAFRMASPVFWSPSRTPFGTIIRFVICFL